MSCRNCATKTVVPAHASPFGYITGSIPERVIDEVAVAIGASVGGDVSPPCGAYLPQNIDLSNIWDEAVRELTQDFQVGSGKIVGRQIASLSWFWAICA